MHKKRKRELEEFIEDLYCYLAHAMETGESHSAILATLLHDLDGINAGRLCFLPRTSGAAKLWPKI